MFKKAERKKAKLRLALTGPSGSGKTYSALKLAKGMGGKIAVLDTEHGSASLYSDLIDFDVVELAPPFEPERYIEVIKAAENAGYDILIIDSMTHEWSGAGGSLDINTAIANGQFRGNTFSAWSKTTPRHNRFIEAILQSPIHIIATMRSKQDFILPEGSKTPKKVGLAPIQRDGLEYEFTAVLDLSIDGNLAMPSKDRTRLFTGTPQALSEGHGRKLITWLNSGGDAIPTHDPVPHQSAPVYDATGTPIAEPSPITEAQAGKLRSEMQRLADVAGKTYDDVLIRLDGWYAERKDGEALPDLKDIDREEYPRILRRVLGWITTTEKLAEQNDAETETAETESQPA